MIRARRPCLAGTLPGGHSGARLEAPTLAETIAERGGRVVSLALKPRSAMMMAGKRGAFVGWYDDTGTWATSNAYTPAFPAFAASYVLKHPVEAFRGVSWNRMPPPVRYTGPDRWTARAPHERLDRELPAHPRRGEFGPGARYYRQWQRTPFADAYLADLAIDVGRRNGARTPGRRRFSGRELRRADSAGHNFGPDSHEVQDVLVQLDRTVGRLLAYLDARVGRGRTRSR